MIIAVHGKLGSGKNSLANAIKELHPSFEIKAFADKLKELCSLLSGQPLEDMYSQEGKNKFLPIWNMTVGEMLQKIGTEVMRDNFDKDTWVKALFSSYTPTKNYVICDVRFPNEVEASMKHNAVLVKIIGDPAGIRANSKRDLNHPSETSLDNWEKWDYVFTNDGTLEDLKEHAENIFEIAKYKSGGVIHYKY